MSKPIRFGWRDPDGHAQPADASRPARIARIPVLGIAAVPLVLHLFTARNQGIFRDEYYYLACARRLAWGHVDQPSLSIVCASVPIVLAADIAARLGGGRFACRMLARSARSSRTS